MDFDAAWCPACDRQIVPKRYTVNVPAAFQPARPPPPTTPSRTKGKIGGLVNGTGCLYNGAVKAPAPLVFMKQRIVIDQGPIPLYCSDECRFADLNAYCRLAPLNPAQEEPHAHPPIKPTKQASFSSSSKTYSYRPSSTPPSSLDKLIAMYNFPPIPTPQPTFDELIPEPAPEYNSGIMMAGRLISSLCPSPAKPQVGRYHAVQERHKPIPGWSDGSNAWRSIVYSITAPKSPTDPFYRDGTSDKAYGSFSPSPSFRRHSSSSSRKGHTSSSTSALTSAPAAISSDEMISKFSAGFIRRSESPISLHNSSATPVSPCLARSLLLSSAKRERLVEHPGPQCSLLVPDVKLKAHSDLCGSLSSNCSGPASASSRRSPLSATTESDGDTEQCDSALPRPKCPLVEKTRSWSYKNVKTYDMMPIPPKKAKKLEKRVVNGQEVVVEVEVEVYEERKRLFLFAPSMISP